MTEVFRLTTNEIAVQGHMATVPLAARENPVWALSAERAGVVRNLLTELGLDPTRTQRITGFADRRPVTEDRLAVRNNRIEIILLRNKY